MLLVLLSMAEAASPLPIPVHAWEPGRRPVVWHRTRQARTLVVSIKKDAVDGDGELSSTAGDPHSAPDTATSWWTPTVLCTSLRTSGHSRSLQYGCKHCLIPSQRHSSTSMPITDKFHWHVTARQAENPQPVQVPDHQPMSLLRRDRAVVRNRNASPLRGWPRQIA